MKINNVYVGNNIDILKTFPDNSIDSVVTDPPYGLGKEPNAVEVLQSWITKGYHEIKGKGFMGKEWDAFVPQPNFWKEIYRVLKPGGYVLSFAGTRTYDWMVMAIRLAGFEVRDCIMWLYGSGFPKSMDISKAIDKNANSNMLNVIGKWLKEKREQNNLSREKVADLLGVTSSAVYNWEENPQKYGFPTKENWNKLKQIYNFDGTWDDFKKEAEREVIGKKKVMGKDEDIIYGKFKGGEIDITLPATELAKQWEGWGTALKPAVEPIVMARKPLDGTVAQNVLKHGVGGINIDGCRVGTEMITTNGKGNMSGSTPIVPQNKDFIGESHYGRFPANVIHDGSDEVVSLFPYTESGKMTSQHQRHTDGSPNGIYGKFDKEHPLSDTYGDSGSASRFFYIAKASQEERNFGLYDFEDDIITDGRTKPIDNAFNRGKTKRKNIHPTVKPIDLMRYLVRLVTPKNGICLDPYLGSGTTAIACEMEKFSWIGIELMPEYAEIAKARISAVKDFEATLDTKTFIKESIKEDKEKELGIQNIFDFMEE